MLLLLLLLFPRHRRLLFWFFVWYPLRMCFNLWNEAIFLSFVRLVVSMNAHNTISRQWWMVEKWGLNNRNQITWGTSFSIALHQRVTATLFYFHLIRWNVFALEKHWTHIGKCAWLPHKSPKTCSKSIKINAKFAEKAMVYPECNAYVAVPLLIIGRQKENVDQFRKTLFQRRTLRHRWLFIFECEWRCRSSCQF